MTPLRMSYMARYYAEQQGYLDRAREASYAYAKRLLAKIPGETLSGPAELVLLKIRAAMADGKQIAGLLRKLYLCAPHLFTLDLIHA